MESGSLILEEVLLQDPSLNVIPGIGALSELNIHDIWETRCSLCARICFVLEGISLSFDDNSREARLAFLQEYMLQKPLKCSVCNAFICAKCAALAAQKAPISGIVVTPLGQMFRTACPFCLISKVEFA